MKTSQWLALSALAGAGLALALRRSRSWPTEGEPCFPRRIEADCNSGRRKSAPTLIVLHSTEGPTAQSAVNTFVQPGAGGSTHVVVGEDGIFQGLDDEMVACGAPGANEQGLHIELAGYASWTQAQWLSRQKTLACAARIVGAWSSRYGIPLRFVDAEGLKAGQSGVTTHAEVSKAFRKTDHWDPGPNFPVDHLLALA